MKAEEKAKEFIEKFKDKVNPYMGSGMLSNTHSDSAILWQSKKCALICVNEMIKQNDKYYLLNGGSLVTEIYKKENAFLFEVKQEIEKLNK